VRVTAGNVSFSVFYQRRQCEGQVDDESFTPVNDDFVSRNCARVIIHILTGVASARCRLVLPKESYFGGINYTSSLQRGLRTV